VSNGVPALVLALVLLVALAAAGLWDLYTLFISHSTPTVSALLRSWASAWPMGAFIAGAIAGHLLWSK